MSGTRRIYSYDGDGLLRYRSQGAATTSFLYDPSVALGRPIVRAAGTLYPSLAVYRYGADGPQLLYFYDGKPTGLAGLDKIGNLPNLLGGK